MKKILALIIAFLIFAGTRVPALAQESSAFVSDYNINIVVDSSGKAYYRQLITVTNQTVDYYLKNYVATLGFKAISNIRVLDGAGNSVPYSFAKEDSGTTLTLNPPGVVGVGNKNVFDISFETEELAKKRGLMWEVIIPGIKASSSLGQYNLALNIPQSFGPPTTAPANAGNDFYTFNYQKNDLLEKGQIINFGLYQLYNFEITYALKNPNILSVELPVTLPPNIANVQRVFFSDFSPAPEKYEEDPDGNQMAYFLAPGGKTITPKVTGQIMVFSNINILASPEIKPAFPYTQEDEFLQVKNPEIQKIAQSLKTPKEVYNYTATHLTYKPVFPKDEITRQGALKALENGEGVCTEFSDLLVTLLRSQGVAAQSLSGFAYSEENNYVPPDDDRVVLHSWVRWFDEQLGWQYTDPTWGATTGLDYFEKFDTNHVVFAIHGQSSVTPYSAGAYVEGSATLKDEVAIDFATEELDAKSLTSFEKLKADYDKKQLLQKAILGKIIIGLFIAIGMGCLVVIFLFLKKILVGRRNT